MDSTFIRVRDVVGQVFQIDDDHLPSVHPDSDLAELARRDITADQSWENSQRELIIALEDEFDIFLLDQETESCNTIEDLVLLIEKVAQE